MIKQRDFEKQHQAEWQSLEQCLAVKGKRSGHSHQHAGFPDLYRCVCQQYALAKERNYSRSLVNRLHRMVELGHQQLYESRPRMRWQLLQFIGRDFAVALWDERRLIAVSAILFMGSLLLTMLACRYYPDLIFSILPPQQVAEFQQMYDSNGSGSLGKLRDADTDLMMFGYYVWNNVGIAFKTFASGFFLGIGSIFILLTNGLSIGAVAGFLWQSGQGEVFFSFVSGHSSWELGAIMICGAAGLRLGLAIVLPGRMSRVQSLQHHSQSLSRLVFGSALLLVIAALIEAFWSSQRGWPFEFRMVIGALGWLFLAWYMLIHGRKHSTKLSISKVSQVNIPLSKMPPDDMSGSNSGKRSETNKNSEQHYAG
ncbi:stage II sporulation protein M [Pelagibaculum spongiae]|uniref:Stage II sporulation protein M n=1 Tax=Pelagibaculum spongiae TaxID=2080658 RepID=A0A2V1GYX7_9GAMM|nr:stage II sporulation protein M [Pelagibaculum spongiae]PVZ68256.1 hypothetical protein DC094_13260 [Pelagibaculum spongiae]